MINKIKSHLGAKLFMLLVSVIVLSVVPLTYATLRAINDYGQKVAELNEVQIRSQAFSYLREIARERADRYQAVFDRIAASAGLLGSQSSAIYSDMGNHSSWSFDSSLFHILPQNRIWADSIDDQVVTFYWGSAELGSDIKNEISALSHMTPLLTRVLAENPEALASHSISVTGIGQYCTDDLKSKAAVYNLPPVAEFDLRDGEPMTIFTKSDDVLSEVRWTDIYKDDVIDGLMLTASAPVYDTKGVFRGITGIDVPLDNVIGDILYSGKSRWSEEVVLFSFLLDRNGKIIAIPQSYYPFFGISVDRSGLINSGDRPDTALADSEKIDVRELARNLKGQENNLSKISHENEFYFVVTHRMAKSGWILGVVVRENDMLSSVRESEVALKNTTRDIQVRSVILSLLTACIAIAIVFVRVRYLVLPLRTLAGATKRVAGGDLTVHCPVTTSDEVGLLADSFNTMVGRLQSAQDQQKRYAEALEVEVERRNIELIDKKSELEETVEQLNNEIERRQIIGEALKNSQQQYYETLEASMAGVYIIENGLFVYVNSSMADMFGFTREELIGLCPGDMVCEEDRPLVAENTRLRLQGDNVLPYTIQWIRRDGTTFYGEVWGKIATWQKRKVMVGTINDVSSIKLKEKLLKVQDQRLQKSLDEKEVLLKEIYHRTKNNMLVIISLLDLQVQDIEDEQVRTLFHETENRIRAMALVHEKMYQSQNLSEIDMGSYLQEIAESLLANMVVDNRIKLLSNFESVPINIDYAVPLGLVINEIVTNAVKHAFPGKRTGSICLSIKKSQDDEIVLVVGDDGVGLPEDIDVQNSTSFGMRIIITSLVKMQLKGTLTVNRENGTRYLIRFPEPKTTKRI
ncbi:MAG: PAS domain S-box protein [Deltaproteobacteria bacterium]|nr:PAS domain S-box protein [Deltaproteobacteria bacterium]